MTFADFDHIILNQLEPDDSALISFVHAENSKAQIPVAARSVSMLQKFFNGTENLHTVKNRRLIFKPLK